MSDVASQPDRTNATDATRRGGFTAPLGLAERLHRPAFKIDVVAVLDLVVIALLFGLLFTRLVVFPGVRVELPTTDLRMTQAAGPVAVLTIGHKGMLLFDGKVFEMSSIARGFESYQQRSDREDAVLLVKAGRSMALQDFMRLCELAHAAGFGEVQLAGEREAEVERLIPGGFDRPAESGLIPVS